MTSSLMPSSLPSTLRRGRPQLPQRQQLLLPRAIRIPSYHVPPRRSLLSLPYWHPSSISSPMTRLPPQLRSPRPPLPELPPRQRQLKRQPWRLHPLRPDATSSTSTSADPRPIAPNPSPPRQTSCPSSPQTRPPPFPRLNPSSITAHRPCRPVTLTHHGPVGARARLLRLSRRRSADRRGAGCRWIRAHGARPSSRQRVSGGARQIRGREGTRLRDLGGVRRSWERRRSGIHLLISGNNGMEREERSDTKGDSLAK